MLHLLAVGALAAACWSSPGRGSVSSGRRRASSAVASASTPFDPPGASRVMDEEAQWAFARLRRTSVSVPGVGNVDTTFYSAGAPSDAATVLYLHGGDSTCLEWKSVIRRAAPALNCVAVDWWTGGWTARSPITAAVNAGAAPWDCIRAHLHAFWREQLGGKPIHLVGTSMGGAVALDFATSHPEAVAKLVLVDAGGESYAAPPPLVGKLLAPFCPTVLRALAWSLPHFGGDAGYLASLHRREAGWQEAYVTYLGSGGYELRVGPERIRSVPQRTLVIWGADDPVLNPADAHAFQRDLPNCAGVREVDGAGHAPHIDRPEAVASIVQEFLEA